MKIALLTWFSLVASSCFSQNPYDTRLVPDSLLKGADVVKRIDENTFRIRDLNQLVQYQKVAYTILNEKGDRFGYISEFYNKFQEITLFDATLFDRDGKKIRSVKRNEVKDESAVSGISLMDDNRIKWFNFFYKEYPYTVEFVIETESRNTMFFPKWLPVNEEKMGVVQSSFTVYCPKDYELRYKLLGGAADAVKTETEKEKVFSWQSKNLLPVFKEPYSLSWYDLTPTVVLAPGKFILQDYAGDMNSWDNFGRFASQLNMGRDLLPENIKAVVRQITGPLQTDKEKIYALYKYLQDNTRYISVQLGIGGWQPFEAAYVASKKYGDCKALSNYMFALLKEAGINSHYTLVNAGKDPNKKWFLTDFSNSGFNHAIVCVPNKGDTVWLECTSQIAYPGYMSDFTDNRYALLITPEGGKVVKTPHYGVNENEQLRKVNAVINEQGNVAIRAITTYRAQKQDRLFGLVNASSKEKVNEVLKTGLDLPNYDLISYDYQSRLEKYPVMEEVLDISALHYVQISGKRLFVIPNIMSRSFFKPMADSTRKFPLRFDNEYRDIDTAVIEVPGGYKPESMPKETAFKSPFGSYSSSVKVEGNKIFYTRLLEKYEGIFNPSSYPEMVKFWEQVYKADRVKLVLVKEG